MNSTTKPQVIRTIAGQFHENPRLRLAVFVAFFILGIYVLLFFSDKTKALRQDYTESLQTFQHMQDLKDQTYWLKRSEKAKSLRMAAEELLWKAPSSGIARANLQNRFDAVAGKHKFPRFRIRTGNAEKVSESPVTWKITVRINGTIAPHLVPLFINSIENFKNATVFSRVEITRIKDLARVAITLDTYWTGWE